MDTLLIDRRTSRRHSRLQRASGPKLDCTYVRSIDRLNTAATAAAASGAAICTECRSPLLQFRGSNLFSLPPFGDTRSSSFRSSPGRMPITSPASAVIHSDGQDRPAARRRGRSSLSYSLMAFQCPRASIAMHRKRFVERSGSRCQHRREAASSSVLVGSSFLLLLRLTFPLAPNIVIIRSQSHARTATPITRARPRAAGSAR